MAAVLAMSVVDLTASTATHCTRPVAVVVLAATTEVEAPAETGSYEYNDGFGSPYTAA